MMTMLTQCPHPDELRDFGQGHLAAEAVDAFEQHVAGCERCCRLLEEAPRGSFEGQLRAARRGAPLETTTDTTGGTVAEVTGVPPQLADHPRYRVLGLVGQGGMGAVFRAEHRHMDRLVALKVINPGLIRNPATVLRFRQEVRAAARLHHPNIVTAYDADEAGGLHFLVMEYVEGRSLADLVSERGPLPTAEACEYVRQTALGLQHAHEQGMVHRDVKPHNLMLTPSPLPLSPAGERGSRPTPLPAGERGSRPTPLPAGERGRSEGVATVKILDFGLARLARTSDEPLGAAGDASAGLTGAGTVMGTAEYVAPEQAADPRTADIRADIYSLGCTLFHLLTGRPPFPSGTVQDKIAKHAAGLVPPLTDLRPDAPAGLAAVVARMTARDLADRFQTPGEVAQALAPFALPAPAAGPFARIGGRKRRRLLAAVLILFAAGIVAAGILALRLHTDRGEIVIETNDSTLEILARQGGAIVRIRDPKSGQTLELDAKKLTVRDLEHADGLALEIPWRGTLTFRSSGGIVTVTSGPKGLEQPKAVHVSDAVELAKRANAADALKRSDIPEIARAYLGSGDAKNVPPELVTVLGDTRFRCSERPGPMAFSPDGKQLAVANDRDEIRFLDAHTGRFMRQMTSPDAPRDQMAFSPDGRHLAGTRDGQFGVIDAKTGQLILKLIDGRVSNVDAFAFASDGKTIGVCGKAPNASTVVEYRDAATGKWVLSQSTRLVSASVTDFAFTPDLQRFAVVQRGGHVVAVVQRGGRVVAHLNHVAHEKGKAGMRVAISPDGKHLAVLWRSATPTEREVTIYDADGDELHTLSGPQGGVEPDNELLAFAPDGKTLIAVSNLSNCVRWDVARGTKLSSAQLPKENRTHFHVLSPDGKIVARRCVVTCRIDLFDTETGKPLCPRVGHERAISSLAFSPDGKYLASTDRFATRLWDLATARAVDTPFEWPIHHLTFSPDGKLLAGANGHFIVAFQVRDGSKRSLQLDAKTYEIPSIAFNPNGSMIAAACGDDVRVWRVADGKELRILGNQNHEFSVTFSPDGSQILAAGDGIKIWDTQTGLEIKHLNGSRYYLLEWLADGKTLAATHTEGWDQRGYVLHVDPESGKILQKLPARIPYPRGTPKGPPHMFPHALSPRARLVCLCEADGFLLMQPSAAAAHRQMFRLGPPGADPYLRTAAFSPDGRYLACGNAEGVISLLRLSELGAVPELHVTLPTARELAQRPNTTDAL